MLRLTALLLGSALLSPSLAATYVVSPDGSGDYPTIQAALDAVYTGDIIELTDGTFSGDGNRDIRFLGKAVTVRSQSGEPGACVIDCAPGTHRGFLFDSGESAASMLLSVTITNGYGTVGGGIYCVDGGSPTISDCILLGNGAHEHGGGLFSLRASPQLIGCVFQDNYANPYYGGGADCMGTSSPRFLDCTFVGNSAGGQWSYGEGGAVRLEYCDALLSSCVFRENTAEDGGGAVFCQNAAATFNRCSFEDNAAGRGGAAFCLGPAALPTFSYCQFTANLAEHGGALYSWYLAEPRLMNSTLYGNSATASGAGFCCANNSSAALENTIISFGGGAAAISCESGPVPTLTCCDIFGNEGGDWTGCIQGQLGQGGNICADPLFCDAPGEDFRLHGDSPCAPFSPPNPECDLIGAWEVGCGPTPVRESSWGGIKALFW